MSQINKSRPAVHCVIVTGQCRCHREQDWERVCVAMDNWIHTFLGSFLKINSNKLSDNYKKTSSVAVYIWRLYSFNLHLELKHEILWHFTGILCKKNRKTLLICMQMDSNFERNFDINVSNFFLIGGNEHNQYM